MNYFSVSLKAFSFMLQASGSTQGGICGYNSMNYFPGFLKAFSFMLQASGSTQGGICRYISKNKIGEITIKN
jgi:hypothetical protein